MEKVWKRKEGKGRPRTALQVREGVPFLYFPALEETGAVVHGFSTRLGGVSQGMYAAMNVSFTRGDREEAVRENYRRLGKAMGFSCDNLVCSDVDGLVTDEPGLVLATFYADCVPLYLVDPVRRCIGLSHAGWRGTAGKIGKKTVELMRERYGSRPEDLYAAVGPSICQDCYEVSGDVIEEFQKAFEQKFWSQLFYAKGGGKYQLDLWRANEIVLLEAGLRPERITITDLCTCCNPDLLFSHRASHGKRGNLGAFLMLKPD